MESSCTFADGDMGSSKSSMMRFAILLRVRVSMNAPLVGSRPR